MDRKTHLSSYEWSLYNVLKHELNTLLANDEEPAVREWLHKKVEDLRNRINAL